MIIGFIIAVAIIFVDQITKIIANNVLTMGETVTFIPGFLKFNLVHNSGAGFSFLEDYPIILTIISLLASIALGYAIYKYGDFKKKKVLTIALAFLLGGCFGNLIDRFLTSINIYDGVVDFIRFYIGSHWFMGTTDNVADIFLVVGVILLFIQFLFLDNVKEKDDTAKNNQKKLKESLKNSAEEGGDSSESRTNS